MFKTLKLAKLTFADSNVTGPFQTLIFSGLDLDDVKEMIIFSSGIAQLYPV
jgi:hypothetical protein